MSDIENEYTLQRERRERTTRETAVKQGKDKDYMTRVVLVQVISCFVMVITVVGIGKLSGTLFEQMREEYGKIMSVDMTAQEIWAAAKGIFSLSPSAQKSQPVQEAVDEASVYANADAASENAETFTDEESASAVIEKDAEITTITSSGGEDIKVLDALTESSFAPVKLSVEAVMPVSGTVTSEFGYRKHPVTGNKSFHTGIDIGADEGTAIAAAYYGIVKAVGFTEGKGKYILMNHGGNVETLYCHCSEILVSKGAVIRAGETIAKVGSTGMSTGPHLHFEVRVDGIRCNPRWVLF